MGGEPTFVSIDDPDGAGMEHRRAGRREAPPGDRALRPAARPATRRGGLVHFGQGKWYPGEPLPRWSLNCFWRRDGEPIWARRGAAVGRDRPAAASTPTAAERLLDDARRAARPRRRTRVSGAYEDRFHYQWRRLRLPVQCRSAPEPRAPDTCGRRARWPGYVLPLARDPLGRAGAASRGSCAASAATSCRAIRRWAGGCRSIRCRGWRRSIATRPSRPIPNQAFPPLPGAAVLRARVAAPRRPGAGKPARAAPACVPAPAGRQSSAPRPGESAPWIPRTALCVEARGGVLYVFMPPLDSARGLPRAGRRRRGHRRGAAPAGRARGLRAAARPAARVASASRPTRA